MRRLGGWIVRRCVDVPSRMALAYFVRYSTKSLTRKACSCFGQTSCRRSCISCSSLRVSQAHSEHVGVQTDTPRRREFDKPLSLSGYEWSPVIGNGSMRIS